MEFISNYYSFQPSGVSGGSIINILAERLSKETDLEWNKWRVFFCDERLVPFNHPESTYGQFKVSVSIKCNRQHRD